MIEAIKLTKNFRHGKIIVQAIKELSLQINSSEIVCLFGRSGSGKTTLLNLLGTLYMPDSGEIIYEGRKLSEIPSRELPLFRRNNIGFVFQHFNLVPYLSALENVELPLKFGGVPRKERRKRAEEILEQMGLSSRLDFTLSRLSGGQIQRVAFARAAVMHPSVVLADEPTGQLDSLTAEELAGTISEMSSNHKISFLIATHDPVISKIAHRTILMEDGKITEDGN